MDKFRKMLDDYGIEWTDESESGIYPIERTHFIHRGYFWSVIHGFGTFGGWSSAHPKDEGLLELMSMDVNCGEPVGYLDAEQVMFFVRGDSE